MLRLILLLVALMNPTEARERAAAELYAARAKAAGCPRDQFLNFYRAGIVLQPRQLLFAAAARSCDHRCPACELADRTGAEPTIDCPACGPSRVAFGGARGGGKTYVSVGQVFCDDCARRPGLKFLYLRKVGKAAREAIQDLRKEVLHSTPHDYRSQDSTLVRRDNGSKLILGHFQNDKDIDNYLGLQYDGLLIEEATQLSARKVRDIISCVRTSKPGWRPRVYFTTNPGNIGHAWFKAMFVAPMRAGAETTTRFIQSTVRDNRFVNAEYRSTLEGETGWKRRAWLDGDWDLAAGQFFTNFRRDLHVRELGPLPRHWRTWLSFDYGIVHYTVVYLLAQDGDGHVWFVDEHAERGWLTGQHAAGIRAMLARHGIAPDDGRIEAMVAGHDYFTPRHTAKSIADDYEAEGFVLQRADIDRVAGASEFARRLGSADADPPIPPTLSIDPRCAGLIDCLPSLQHSTTRPEDVQKVDCDEDGLGGDDFYDSGRYGLMYAAAPRGGPVADPFADLR